MASEEDTRYSDNDTGPFASQMHELVPPQEVPLDIDMRDRDVIVDVWVNPKMVRLLHLQNVRDDTAAEARKAVDGFLEDLKAMEGCEGDHSKRVGVTTIEDFTQAHLDLREHIEARSDELGLGIQWAQYGFPRDMFRRACSQPKYIVHWVDDECVKRITGTRGLPYPEPRGPRAGGDGGDKKDSEA
jgi:hypothetical protein